MINYSLILFSFCCLLFLNSSAQTPSSTCGPNGGVSVYETNVTGNIRNFYWTQSKSTVYAVTDKDIAYVSNDGGISWTNIMSSLGTNDRGVRYIVFGADEKKVYFVSRSGFWTTIGSGVYNYHSMKDYTIYQIIPHPFESEWSLFIWQTTSCTALIKSTCHFDLFVSTNFAQTYTNITNYVNMADWGGVGQDVIYTSVDNPKGNQIPYFYQPYNSTFYVSNDMGKTTVRRIAHVAAFIYMNNLLYLAVVDNPDSTKLNLLVSNDLGKTITRAEFGSDVNIEERAYTILDNSEGATFVNVDVGNNYWGNLYVANSFDEIFTLSLARNKRSTSGAVDFSRILSLDGIYIANSYNIPIDEIDYLIDKTNVNQYLTTMITFDKGGIWTRLPVPDNEPCLDKGCSLHLFGRTQTRIGSIYSKPTAVGLILATGNVGAYQLLREDALNTYFSRDAGLSWTRIRNGSNVYAFGDHGAIMVMTTNEQKTNSLVYSWNEGLNWTDCRFTSVEVDVTNINVEPSATSQRFILYGSRLDSTNGSSSGVLFTVDFSNLHENQCQGYDKPGTAESDYEYWSPSSNLDRCLMGQKIQYVRRKRDRECYNGETLEKSTIPVPCPCTREDYMCDGDCFQEVEPETCTTTETCERQCVNICSGQSNDPQQPPANCKDYYYRTNGYKLIPGDACDASQGLNLGPTKTKCPKSTNGLWSPLVVTSIFVFGLVFFVAAAIVVGLVLYRTNDKFRNWLQEYLPSSGKDNSLYSLVSTDTEPDMLIADLDEDIDDHHNQRNSNSNSRSTQFSSLPQVYSDEEAPAIDAPTTRS